MIVWPRVRRSTFFLLSVLAVALAGAERAAAQKPPVAKPKGPQGMPDFADEIRVRSDRNGFEKGRTWYEGFVDL